MVDRDRVEHTVKKAVKIIKKMEGEDRDRDKLLAALIVLVDKLVDENTLEKLWEEFSMLNFFRFAEKKFREEGLREGMREGMKEGMKEGIKEGIREGIVEVIFRQLKKKFGDVPEDYRYTARNPRLLGRKLEKIGKVGRITKIHEIKGLLIPLK